MLKLVQRDITEREHLIQFVFKERLEQMGGGDGMMFSNEDTDRDYLNEEEENQVLGGQSSDKKHRHHKNKDRFNIRETDEEQDGYQYGESEGENGESYAESESVKVGEGGVFDRDDYL